MKSRGFTLIELAIVLAIIAILAGVLTPIVTAYLEQSRVGRAQADLRTIADAVRLFQRDTGQWPVFDSSANYAGNQCCGGSGNKLIGAGNGSNPPDGAATWNVSAVVASSSLETYLNGNFASVSTTSAFPKKGFNGPYIGNVDSDPWGGRYILTAANLSTAGYHAYVISAGPNGVLDTGLNQAATGAFTIGTDDIVSVIK